MLASRIGIQTVRPAVVTMTERRIVRTPSTMGNPAQGTCSEEVWELKSQTNSWTEDWAPCSHPTPSPNQLHHQPCSEQSLSRVQTVWLSQTTTTISTSMCRDFLALPLGTYKAVFVH
jgi:hypothetical protein